MKQIKRAKVAWKMWKFNESNVYVVANNRTDAKMLFNEYMSEGMYYEQSLSWSYKSVQVEGTCDWYDYIVQGPNVWFQPAPDSNQLERVVLIKRDEAKRILRDLSEEIDDDPLDTTLKRALWAEVVNGISNDGVPYYIRRHAKLHGDHEGHCTISYRLFYTQITPGLAVYQIDIDVNDPRWADSHGDEDEVVGPSNV